MVSFSTLFTDRVCSFHGLFFLEIGTSGLEITTDLIIAIASYTVAAGLILTTRQRHRTIPGQGLFWLWAASFGMLGTLHLVTALPSWLTSARLASVVEALTALILFCAAIAALSQLPKLLATPTRPSDGVADSGPAAPPVEPHTAESAPALEQQVASCTQALEKAHEAQGTLLEYEQTIRGDLEVALENLQDTAERLNIALSAAKMGTWEWNLVTDQLDWSPQAKEILGFAPSYTDFTYATWADRIHADDLPQVEAALAHARTSKTIFSEEYRLQIPNAAERWVRSQGRFVFSLDGKPRRLIGVTQDITEDKQASMALRSSEARFRAVFEQAAVGMARLSTEGNWLQVNKTFCDLLGYQADELTGKHFSDITDPDDATQDEHYYQALFTGEVDSCRLEKRYLHRDGHPIWMMVTASTERDDEGNLISFIAVIEDISKLKHARQELEQRAKELERLNNLLAITNAMLEKRHAELDQFAYVASHDLKAPLRAIANLSEWIEEDLGDQLPEENQHQLNLLRSRVHRMEALINGLLEYSRVGRREKQIVEVNVRQLTAEAIDFLSPPETFTFELPPEDINLTTNKTALNQVLYNLIGNAVKHHDRDNGRVEITAQDHGDRIEFTVSDDGPGIAPEYHEKVFTIFQTLKSRDELESTGIGLSLVKKIVESEGGNIRLESDLGEGATFRFTWPKQ